MGSVQMTLAWNKSKYHRRWWADSNGIVCRFEIKETRKRGLPVAWTLTERFPQTIGADRVDYRGDFQTRIAAYERAEAIHDGSYRW